MDYTDRLRRPALNDGTFADAVANRSRPELPELDPTTHTPVRIGCLVAVDDAVEERRFRG
jgi:hypothetical protein